MLFLEDSTKTWASDDPVRLVWTDPPFGTDKSQASRGNSYRDTTPRQAVDDTIAAIRLITPVLLPDATVCVCADYRAVHSIAHRMCEDGFHLRGEIVWEFGLGRPRTSWWPNRHNTILTFTLAKDSGLFDNTAIPRTERLAPKPGYPADKNIGSVWNKTLSNTDRERVGYPNQKPLDIILPFVAAHTRPGDVVADPFMGSGSVGDAALRSGRAFVGQDSNPQSIEVCKNRLKEVTSAPTGCPHGPDPAGCGCWLDCCR